MAGAECDVCGRGGVAGVCSSGFAAVSIAICAECLKQGAEPAWVLDATVGDGDETTLQRWHISVSECPVWDMTTKQYMPFKQWRALYHKDEEQ